MRYDISIEDIPMTDFNLPLSGAVTQTFPWTVNYTINLGESSNTAIEGDALSVASYGKQLGRISDVLIVLLKHVQLVGTLSPDEEKALCDLRTMLDEIANKKQAHGARLVLRPPELADIMR
jgi:hypothetical protein